MIMRRQQLNKCLYRNQRVPDFMRNARAENTNRRQLFRALCLCRKVRALQRPLDNRREFHQLCDLGIRIWTARRASTNAYNDGQSRSDLNDKKTELMLLEHFVNFVTFLSKPFPRESFGSDPTKVFHCLHESTAAIDLNAAPGKSLVRAIND